MLYRFKCQEHGTFEVQQSMMSDHKLDCPKCGNECQRIYSMLQWRWANDIFRKDGSRREDKDYAPVMRG